MDETTLKVMRFASQGLYCSQIIMALALETCGVANPGLLRSLSGLAYGCGSGSASCGVLTGASCVLALYAGKAGPGEEESPALWPMLEELSEWFAAAADGRDGAVTCQAIMGDDLTRTPQQKCGTLAATAFAKVMEMLAAYGFDPTDTGRPDDC